MFRTRLGQVWIVFHCAPLGGAVRLAPSAHEGRLVRAILYLAGVGGNILALVGLDALHHAHWLTASIASPLAWAQIAGFINLIPFRGGTRKADPFESDGWQLLALPFRGPDFAYRRARDYVALITHHPGAEIALTSRSAPEIIFQLIVLAAKREAWQGHAAVRTLKKILDHETPSDTERAVVMATVAAFQLERHEFYLAPEELEAWSRTAVDLYDAPLIKTSRSLVLEQQQRFEEAIGLAQEVLGATPSATTAPACQRLLERIPGVPRPWGEARPSA